MIYDKPIYRALGDCYLGVEFGDEADMSLNFKVLALAQRLEQEPVEGIVEVIPSLRELALVIDRERTTHRRVEEAIGALVDDLEQVTSLPSRRVRLPCWYDDPWSAEVAARYGVQKNIELVADHNGVSVDEAIERHTGTDFWVACVGFTPGCFFAFPLDDDKRLVGPKWRTPRDYSPARCLALAGFATGAYPVASPGGYQLLGRLAVNIYEATPKNSVFPEDGVLLRAGDRLRFYAVGPREYEEIWEQVQAGSYPYDVTDGVFDVQAYLAAADAGNSPVVATAPDVEASVIPPEELK